MQKLGTVLFIIGIVLLITGFAVFVSARSIAELLYGQYFGGVQDAGFMIWGFVGGGVGLVLLIIGRSLAKAPRK